MGVNMLWQTTMPPLLAQILLCEQVCGKTDLIKRKKTWGQLNNWIYLCNFAVEFGKDYEKENTIQSRIQRHVAELW